MPSPEFQDAGKFKIQRSSNGQKLVGSELDNLSLAKAFYKESYDQVLAVSYGC